MGKGDVQLLCDNMDDNVCWITGCSSITIQGVHARHTNPTEDERCYGNVFGIDSSDDIKIINCEIHGCGAIGVYVYNSDNVELRDNHIHDNRFWAVQFEGEGLLSEDHQIEGLTLEGNTMERNGCQEGVVYAEDFTIASFIGIEDVDYIYFLFKESEHGDTIRFLVSDECEECYPILHDPDGHRGVTMEIEWEEVGAIMLGTEECVRMKRIASILILD
jgi:parallel beta-helix repeat protein